MRLVLESAGVLTNRVVEGVALTSSVSANGNIYSEEEIFSAKNLNVPLRLDWEHTDEVIGNVVFSLNKKERRIEYKGIITSEKRALEIKEGTHKVSIEANIDEVKESCTRTRCYNLVEGITFEGLAITSNPSVSTTSLKIIESFQEWPAKHGLCESCVSDCLKNKAEDGKDPTDPQNQAICYSECKEKENITSNITTENPSLNT